MKKIYTFIIFSFIVFFSFSQSCPPGQTLIKVLLVPDSYPGETSWVLKDQNGNTVLSGNANSDSVCVPNNSCHTFTIYDSYGDGICCGYGNGSYTIFVNGAQVTTGGNFGSQESVDVNCPPGTSCTSALPVTTGSWTAPAPNTWYIFTPDSNGMYEITTCFPSNCNTTIWVYAACGGLIDQTNAGTIYYNDNSAGCGTWGVITAALDTLHSYLIRIGGDASCTGDSILWALNYNGPITGCMDTAACNYNPMAVISDGSCAYFPSPLCGGPDLVVSQNDFENSLSLGTQASDFCSVQEGCLNGYGNRTVINFTTRIDNIGNTDYYIGDPVNNPSQFNSTNCHGHPHYEGYAEYVLYNSSGQMVPIGFKNGFCVIDLVCTTGTAQYGCNNMGITAGCGDIYSSGLPCQWIDITDVDPGSYIMAIKVNWDQSPDALGRQEVTYTNNWAQVCIDITVDAFGNKSYSVNNNCPPYVDCAGVPYGNAQMDCQGTCNGTVKMGDLNSNTQQETADAQQYVSQILNSTISPTPCNDLNDDTLITVWDAALLQNCVLNSTPYNTACVFPHGIVNPYQTVSLKIDTLNTAQGYVDIHMLAPQSDVTAYEFDLHGLNILNVVSLVNSSDYPSIPDYLAGGKKVISISYIDSSISRSPNWQPLCRVYYSALTDTVVCIEKIVDIVNKSYEATLTTIVGPCMPAGNVGIKENDRSNYFLAWPNPTKGLLNLSTHFEERNGTITVTDVLGKTVMVKQLNLSAQNTALDISGMADGVYTITIRTNTASTSKRIILSH